MTLRNRFVLAIGGVALLMVLPALYAALQLNHLRDIASEIGQSHGAAYLAMGRFQTRLAELDRLERSYVAVPADDVGARRDTALANARLHLDQLRNAGYDSSAAMASTQLEDIAAGISRIDALIDDGRADDATDELENVKPLFAATDTLLQSVAFEIDARSEADLLEAARISAAALTTTLLSLAACFFIAVLLGAWATTTVIRPVQRLRHSMAAVAAGEFVVPAGLPYERADEIGDLSRSFRSMASHLSELDRMKADFMSIATHELKTPINVVSGYAELIQEGVYGEVGEKQQDALTSIQEQARILTQLVNQLLDISRLEAGGLKLEMHLFSVTELMERVRRTFDVLAHRNGIELTVEQDASTPASVQGDQDRLRDQVLGNLLANALKFTPQGGTITVRSRGTDGSLVIEVADSGEGMPADQLPHVFDKYFQIGEQARSKGAGLGLTIADEIVNAHGGDISVESVEGEGTMFTIILPVAQPSAPERGAAGQ